MRRAEVYDARLDPTEGSEEGGTRPVIIVSPDAINANSRVVLAVPCTTFYPQRRIYPSQILISAPNGGLDRDTVALGEQVRVLAKLIALQSPSCFAAALGNAIAPYVLPLLATDRILLLPLPIRIHLFLTTIYK